ncbi:thermonuclease family protein [soil metagenome]
MKKIKASLLSFFILTCFALLYVFEAKAEIPNCFVISVTDGDTFKAIYQGKIINCRLAMIDAPELKQAYGAASRDSLARLISNKTGTLTVLRQDRYNRALVKLAIGNSDVQECMLEKGMAWVYTNYTHDKYLQLLELNAQTLQAGLWACKRRIPPWQFRGLSKTAKQFFAGCG